MKPWTIGRLAMVFLLGSMASEACKFPDALYRDRGSEPWLYKVMWTRLVNYTQNKITRVYFNETSFKTVESDYDARSSVHKETFCVEKVRNHNTFIVYEDTAAGKAYKCVRFIRRSRNVYQWQMSPLLPNRHTRQCNFTGTDTDPWPLIFDKRTDKYLPFQKYDACPLSGGFVVATWKNASYHELTCSRTLLPGKIENECLPGEGLTVSLHRECAVELKRRYGLNQRVWESSYCHGSWYDSGYQYMLLRPKEQTFSGSNYWCLRYRYQHADRFPVDVFLAPFCGKPGDVPAPADGVTILRPILYRQPVTINSDEVATCAARIPAHRACSDEEKAVCAKHCGRFIQQKMNYAWPQFDEYLRGTWYKDSSQLGQQNVSVNAFNLEFPQFGTFVFVGTKNRMRDTDHYSLLSVTRGGCSIRVTNMFVRNTSHSVVGMSFSQPKPLSLFDVYRLRLQAGIQTEDAFPLYTKYRTGENYMNVVRLGKKHIPVDCDVPGNIIDQLFVATFPEGQCGAVAFKKAGEKHLLAVQLGCNGTSVPEPLSNYSCLASYAGAEDDTYVITRRVGGQGSADFLCWHVTSHVVHWMHVSDCNERAVELMEAGFISPRATFTRHTNAASDTGRHAGLSILAASVFVFFLMNGFL